MVQIHRWRTAFSTKHPLKYQHVVDSDRQKNTQVKSITNFLSCLSNNPVSDKVSADLKVAIAQWIASSGRPTAIVEYDGLQTVLRIAFQNQIYTLPSRRTMDTLIGQMYGEKLKEHKKAIESIQSTALTIDFWTSNNNESYCTRILNKAVQLKFTNFEKSTWP